MTSVEFIELLSCYFKSKSISYEVENPVVEGSPIEVRWHNDINGLDMVLWCYHTTHVNAYVKRLEPLRGTGLSARELTRLKSTSYPEISNPAFDMEKWINNLYEYGIHHDTYFWPASAKEWEERQRPVRIEPKKGGIIRRTIDRFLDELSWRA